MDFSAIGFVGTYGIQPNGMRAMSPAEIEGYQLLNAWAMQNARLLPADYAAMRNWSPREEKPLDERFSDFKKRLAAAIEKRRAA